MGDCPFWRGAFIEEPFWVYCRQGCFCEIRGAASSTLANTDDGRRREVVFVLVIMTVVVVKVIFAIMIALAIEWVVLVVVVVVMLSRHSASVAESGITVEHNDNMADNDGGVVDDMVMTMTSFTITVMITVSGCVGDRVDTDKVVVVLAIGE